MIEYPTAEGLPIATTENKKIDAFDVEKLFSNEQLRLSRSEIPFAAKVIAIFYLVALVFHGVLLQGLELRVMVPAAFFASSVAFAVWWFCRKKPELSKQDVLRFQLLFCLATASNALLHLWSSGEIEQTVNILLLFIFLIYLRLPVWLFALMSAVVTLAWLFIALGQAVEVDMMVHYGFGLAISNSIASLIYVNNRRLTYQGMEGFRDRLLLQRQLKLANERLSELALQDPLTGIANRRSLRSFYDKLSQRAGLAGESITVVLCDLDNFKPYNDSWGHVAGDGALVRVGQLLNDNVRGIKDLAGRLGGDEFALILSDTDAAGAQRFAERIYQHVPLRLADETEITVSMGLYSFIPNSRSGFDEVFEKADKALYKSKSMGKGQFSIESD